MDACSRCGRTRDPESDPADAMTWVTDRDERGRTSWICPRCAREHVRDIETKLDQSWW